MSAPFLKQSKGERDLKQKYQQTVVYLASVLNTICSSDHLFSNRIS